MRINPNLEMPVNLVCPHCKHEHPRYIKKGVLVEDGRFTTKATEEIIGLLPSYSTEPKSNFRKQNPFKKERDAIVFDKGQEYLAEAWFEHFGGIPNYANKT